MVLVSRSCQGPCEVWAENDHHPSAYSSLSLGILIHPMMEHGVSSDCEHVVTYLPCLLKAVVVDVSIDHWRDDFFQLVFIPDS